MLSILQEKCDGDKIETKSTISLGSFPSCRDVLKQHMRRENDKFNCLVLTVFMLPETSNTNV